MNFLDQHLLTALVFLPLCGALSTLAFPPGEHTGVRAFALGVTLVDFVLALWMWARFEPQTLGMQLTERAAWVPSWGIGYSIGVDGIAVLLVVMTTFLAPLVILSTYSSVETRVREYMVCVLILQTAMLGAFVATDLFLFYVFWEAMLIPMYFLVGVWGGKRRIYAALKFFLYTMAGSLLMLVAIVYTVWAARGAGEPTFNWAELVARLSHTSLGGAEPWLFAAFALAFAIKVPMFPFHTWLPDAHVEAPTGGSVILAGVMLKLGTFGFLRYALWLYPHAAATFLPALGMLATVGIIYGAAVAMVQSDLKRLVAYSSVSHLGFVMLGLSAMTVTSLTGSVLQMINHGISTGALFLLVGVIYERRHTRELADFGGIARCMPLYCSIFVFIALSSMGLPGLNGFVGEFMILMGTFVSHGVALGRLGGGPAITANADMAQLGMILLWATAGVALWTLGKKIGRARRDGQMSNASFVAALSAAIVMAALLVMPPLGGGRGGLLVAPLAQLGADGAAFVEIYAMLAVLATAGVIFAAVYLLVAVQRVFFGPLANPANAHLADLSLRETLVIVPLALTALGMGLYPQPFLDVISPSVGHYAQQFRSRAGMAPLEVLGGQGGRASRAPPPPHDGAAASTLASVMP